MQKAVLADSLCYAYRERSGHVEALRGLTLTVEQGEIFGFLGPNGAGKTTTIKLILGILSPQKGGISIFGKDPVSPAVRYSVGYMPETAEYYRYLTPVEILRMYGEMFAIPRNVLSGRIDQLLELVGLRKDSSRLIGGFSKGMMQKVSFAQALINDPDLLVLDEPTGGLDPLARRTMRDVILSFKQKGKTIFFSSHELSEVELISDRIGILNKGQLVACGPLKEVISGKGASETLESYFLKMIEAK